MTGSSSTPASPRIRFGVIPLILVVLGLVCLVFLVGFVFLVWYEIHGAVWIVSEELIYTGFSYLEGKFVVAIAAVVFALTMIAILLFRKMLPAVISINSGLIWFIVLIILFKMCNQFIWYWQGIRSVGAGVKVTGGTQLGLYLALGAAVAAAGLFTAAAVSRPCPLLFLRKWGARPVIEKHGVLTLSVVLAVLVWVVWFAFRLDFITFWTTS